MDKNKQLNLIKEDFKNYQKIPVAIGDETRQAILMVLRKPIARMGYV